MSLPTLAEACRTSGLKVVELDGWQTRGRPSSTGGFMPSGVLCHHTGSYDGLTDATDDATYARWLATVGRSDLPAPLCHLSLSAEGVVYVCAAGRANHAGTAKATGPMPAGDGNYMYIGIEAMNSGSQGWGSVGSDASGAPVTQGEAYARLCAALCRHYGWEASHVRAHRETSVTGKWDPGLLDMDQHRADVARLINAPQEDDMAQYADDLAAIKANTEKLLKGQERANERAKAAADRIRKRVNDGNGKLRDLQGDVDELVAALGGSDG